MTKQELIDHLKHLEQYTHYSEDAPALREVIEMLKCSEVPNSSDTISRKAALDVIFPYCPDDDGACSKADEDIRNLLDELEDLPSAQTEQRWIPCSERLPENDKSVLATTAWGEVTIAERIYPPINDTCWFIHDGNTNATIDDVIAWMPLPEPYEGGNDA